MLRLRQFFQHSWAPLVLYTCIFILWHGVLFHRQFLRTDFDIWLQRSVDYGAEVIEHPFGQQYTVSPPSRLPMIIAGSTMGVTTSIFPKVGLAQLRWLYKCIFVIFSIIALWVIDRVSRRAGLRPIVVVGGCIYLILDPLFWTGNIADVTVAISSLVAVLGVYGYWSDPKRNISLLFVSALSTAVAITTRHSALVLIIPLGMIFVWTVMSGRVLWRQMISRFGWWLLATCLLAVVLWPNILLHPGASVGSNVRTVDSIVQASVDQPLTVGQYFSELLLTLQHIPILTIFLLLTFLLFAWRAWSQLSGAGSILLAALVIVAVTMFLFVPFYPDDLFTSGLRYSSPALISINFLAGVQLLWLYRASRLYKTLGTVLLLVVILSMHAFGIWYYY